MYKVRLDATIRSLFLDNLKVLDALGESPPCATYDSWKVYIPEGEFLSRIGPTEFFKVNFYQLTFSSHDSAENPRD